MGQLIRIGTRTSALAIYQANQVAKLLAQQGYDSQIVKIDTLGDANLQQPLYSLGVVGVFTKALDTALLNGTIDVAVHSLKDVPTQLPDNIVQAAVLPRDDSADILVYKHNELPTNLTQAVIATSSLRRKAQWLHRYPQHKIVNIRGNLATRLQKLQDNPWHGAIFSSAGLQRLNIEPQFIVKLDWMLPAPGQGSIVMHCLSDNNAMLAAGKLINDVTTQMCTSIEREFLQLLEGGCTAPIGAKVDYDSVNQQISLAGVLLSIDGTTKIVVKHQLAKSQARDLASQSAQYVLDNGGRQLVEQLAKLGQ